MNIVGYQIQLAPFTDPEMHRASLTTIVGVDDIELEEVPRIKPQEDRHFRIPAVVFAEMYNNVPVSVQESVDNALGWKTVDKALAVADRHASALERAALIAHADVG